MNKVTIPKMEYIQLKKQAIAYKKLTSRLFEAVIKDPIQEIVEDFKKTDFYSNDFIKDLEAGLRRSSYR